jgi:amino acid transporter
MAAIIFTLILTLTAPFFGREALLWVVDMSALGVTIAYFYSCFIAYKLFKWSDNDTSNNDRFSIVSPVRKFFALLGTISSIGFFLLLVVPGSPGFLSTPSWIALAVWVGLGALFFLIRYKHYSAIPEDELDYLILGDHSANRKPVEEKPAAE